MAEETERSSPSCAARRQSDQSLRDFHLLDEFPRRPEITPESLLRFSAREGAFISLRICKTMVGSLQEPARVRLRGDCER